jgi:hypothetical protein
VRFDDVIARLRTVRWGRAAAWSPEALAWLRAYYQRLVPLWPSERARLAPTDRVIEEAALAALPDDARARIAAEADALWAAARERGERVEPATKKLVTFVLAWARAVDSGTLDPERDPGAPLLDLFAAGFQVNYTTAGIELHYAAGWNIAPVPARASFA